MNRLPPLYAALVTLAAACGGVKHRDDCRTSAGCPVGQYCAQTREGSVCWPDPVPPVVSGLTVACGTLDCPRDGTLVVTAEATDDVELSAVEATVDLDPFHAFPLVRGSGSSWSGTVQLADVEFPAYSSAVVVTVRARDGARNESFAVAMEGLPPAGQRPVVTRERWVYESSGALTPPAVTADGTAVFGRSDTLNQLVAVAANGTKAWSRALGSGTVTAPPRIGAQAIWVGANDGKLYAVALDGSAEIATRRCPASGVAKGPPAVLTTGVVDVAFGAFSTGRIYASGPTCVPTEANDSSTAGAAISASGSVIGVTGAGLAATLRRFGWDGETFTTGWSVDVGGEVIAPIAFDVAGNALTGSKDMTVSRTTTAGVSASLATLAGSIDSSPIVLSGGDIVVGDASGLLHRLTSAGDVVAGFPVDLGAAVHAPMALMDGPVRFLVATENGRVHALSDAGVILWSGALTTGTALGAGNIHTAMDCAVASPCISTAYFGGADGKLYAVIVEGRLDTDAPWPKAWHDARNTSRAGGAF
jgi:outer membrane protein assembly factor BamB